MANPPFKYQPMFEHGEDKTEYYLLTKDYVSVSEFEGKPILKIEKEGLTAMANAAFRDVSFLLRRAHNEQVAKILTDPEASDNDKYVALTFLRNAEVSAKGKLPLCQDTGTAIIHGEKGQQVWTGYCDEEALSLGVYKTYTAYPSDRFFASCPYPPHFGGKYPLKAGRSLPDLASSHRRWGQSR